MLEKLDMIKARNKNNKKWARLKTDLSSRCVT